MNRREEREKRREEQKNATIPPEVLKILEEKCKDRNSAEIIFYSKDEEKFPTVSRRYYRLGGTWTEYVKCWGYCTRHYMTGNGALHFCVDNQHKPHVLPMTEPRWVPCEEVCDYKKQLFRALAETVKQLEPENDIIRMADEEEAKENTVDWETCIEGEVVAYINGASVDWLPE